jgi:uncharacterized protein YukE
MTTGSSSDATQMSGFLKAGDEAATAIRGHYNTWANSVSILDASKGAFAAAFQNTKVLVEQELTNISNEMHGIATNVGQTSQTHQQADEAQDAELKRVVGSLNATRP